MRYMYDNGFWTKSVSDIDKNGDEEVKIFIIPITEVPLDALLREYEDMVLELASKEIDLAKVKEEYNQREFEIVYQSDIDFKALYGGASEKVRKHHAEGVLKELDTKKSDLELSIGFIKNYIPLLKEVIRTKNNAH